VIASLSRSELVQEAEEMKKTVIEAFPDSEMAAEYRELAKTLLKICGVSACRNE
jgi:nitrogenase iron protein NifH